MESKARNESIKLAAGTLNAFAILLLATSMFGLWVEPTQALTMDSRGWMFVLGLTLHALAHTVLGLLDLPEARR